MTKHLPKKADESRSVAQARAMLDASYELSLPSKRIILMCLADLNAHKMRQDHSGEFVITAAAYAGFFGGSRQTSSLDVREGLKELWEAKVEFYPGDDSPYERGKTRWVSAIETVAENSPMAAHKITIAPKIFPYLVELEKGFAKFQMADCRKLTSTAQVRLYEDLCAWRNTGWWRTTLEDFAKRYGFTESTIGRMSWFRRNFLDSAISRINKNTPLRVAVETNGRSLMFTIVDTFQTAKANLDDLPTEPQNDTV